jgi:myo-inositol-1(or 4)-monophosphatase
MVKRVVVIGRRMSPFRFADPERPATLCLPRGEASNLERELTTLVESILKAGTKVRELVKVGFDVQTKSDRSPVTSVDHEVNRILHEMQEKAFPLDGWLSEESPDNPVRLTSRRVWIVDPIDGTKALVNRIPEFCISVALIERGMPVVAAILNPSTDELFTAVRGGGLFLNGTRITPSPTYDVNPAILVNTWEFRIGRWSTLAETARCRPMHSIANALALVASGRIQGALTIEPEYEWDVAAGVLLITESGGTISDAAGKPFVFNQPTPRFRGVIAVAATSDKDLRANLQAHAERAGSTSGREQTIS